ncbi:DUF6339 family protein [Streptomyces sp. DSM 44917]|uniref:DUF6339 family protein n=1 Tax=Streptomyces boetiae TaxID=3075541 RepID=A0ABU2L9Y1_9ACTN|nr:DUF6339 family protein [Streptomyces sp. DSM 44917]MDT0308364.1 DUF6339 family protein [Streptomyces sp. DSM 44917]
MTRAMEDLPERLHRLRDALASKYLTRGVLTGQERPPLVALMRSAEPIEEAGTRWSTAPVRDLFEDAMRRFDEGSRTQADAWLAPRLHATLRMTRAEAADSALWNFLALVVAPDYVVWRHLPRPTKKNEVPTVAAARFRGIHYTQALARLWWAAELFRDGEDYGPAVAACRNQDVLNTVLRLDVIDHRPTARAVIRLLETGAVGTGREVNALATAVNSAGSTLMFEITAPDEGPDVDALRHWIEEAELAPPVSRDSLPAGPEDGPVPAASVESLVEQFGKLFADAPVRGKEKTA